VNESPRAYVTVTDAAGRVLFRRLATPAEIEEAMRVASDADAEAEASLRRIAAERKEASIPQMVVPPVAHEAEESLVANPDDFSEQPFEHANPFGMSDLDDLPAFDADAFDVPHEGKGAA
jgi:hypothetical protein